MTVSNGLHLVKRRDGGHTKGQKPRFRSKSNPMKMARRNFVPKFMFDRIIFWPYVGTLT